MSNWGAALLLGDPPPVWPGSPKHPRLGASCSPPLAQTRGTRCCCIGPRLQLSPEVPIQQGRELEAGAGWKRAFYEQCCPMGAPTPDWHRRDPGMH